MAAAACDPDRVQPLTAVSGPQERRDADQRRAAAHMEWQKQGMWVIIWGPYTRLFWAFARWPVPPEGGVVSAENPADLYHAMRNEERRYDFLRWRYGRRAAAEH